MSSASIILLLFYVSLSSVISYKLPLIYEKPNNSPLGLNDQLEGGSRSDEDSPIYVRMKREIEDANSTVISLSTTEMASESPLIETSDTTPHILEAKSSPPSEPSIFPLGEETTTSIVDQSTKEDEVTVLLNASSSPTNWEELSTFPSTIPNKVTMVTQGQSTDNNEHISSVQATTTDQLSENVSSTALPKEPDNTSTKPPVILNGRTTGHDSTSTRTTVSYSFPSVMATSVATFSDNMVYTQSLIKQCMLTILILAVVCTVFIVTTIALAAKISALKQKQKHYNTNYTEMRCISSLLPDNDQPGKSKPERLKTFAGSIEDNDGDDNTLNSFLPD